ncbi:hypothetical protein RHMOL_Rhmol04G0226900 [Rhododendron molle]|uniref:Uncharacterized protein n=1 Tax=Rhododendron molle TaxID=49168 RepID=A0ACC0P4J4_RHOML|nr:hypothetical protein RHMOL_Rhmol04G0226900 [Rhododendron molle]
MKHSKQLRYGSKLSFWKKTKKRREFSFLYMGTYTYTPTCSTSEHLGFLWFGRRSRTHHLRQTRSMRVLTNGEVVERSINQYGHLKLNVVVVQFNTRLPKKYRKLKEKPFISVDLVDQSFWGD